MHYFATSFSSCFVFFVHWKSHATIHLQTLCTDLLYNAQSGFCKEVSGKEGIFQRCKNLTRTWLFNNAFKRFPIPPNARLQRTQIPCNLKIYIISILRFISWSFVYWSAMWHKEEVVEDAIAYKWRDSVPHEEQTNRDWGDIYSVSELRN